LLKQREYQVLEPLKMLAERGGVIPWPIHFRAGYLVT
jgi:hypothetical protein